MFKRAVGRKREMALVGAGLIVAVGGVFVMADTETDDGESDGFSGKSSGPFYNPQLRDWADGMCESRASLRALRVDSLKQADRLRGKAGEPASEQASGSVASSYLLSAAKALDNISREFGAVDSLTRIPDTERLRAAYVREIDRVRPEVGELSDAEGLARLSARERIGRAERVTSLVAAIKEPSPSFDELAQTNGLFESAANSPGCVAIRAAERERSEPTPTPKPPPLPAADGTSVAACADGACEVRVTKPATRIKVRDLTLEVDRNDTEVTVRHSYPSGGAVRVNLSGEGARGTFGRGGGTIVTVELKGINTGNAVLGINSSS
ncbi:hypothetical protein [Streptomyces sp. NPDC059943]|uniref:hypothetical protein n=1 Tax=Streptomyces sp. NPDC059943 TaxID=3347010 RepID=UPI003654F9F0